MDSGDPGPGFEAGVGAGFEGWPVVCPGSWPAQPLSWPLWLLTNRPWTLPVSDSTRETPVVMSTNRRSPRSTFLHWVRTTPPTMVIKLVLVSNTAVSPVTTWSFCVTTTLPCASSRLIEELPPGPGVADCIGAPAAAAAVLVPLALAGGGGCCGFPRPPAPA